MSLLPYLCPDSSPLRRRESREGRRIPRTSTTPKPRGRCRAKYDDEKAAKDDAFRAQVRRRSREGRCRASVRRQESREGRRIPRTSTTPKPRRSMPRTSTTTKPRGRCRAKYDDEKAAKDDAFRAQVRRRSREGRCRAKYDDEKAAKDDEFRARVRRQSREGGAAQSTTTRKPRRTTHSAHKYDAEAAKVDAAQSTTTRKPRRTTNSAHEYDAKAAREVPRKVRRRESREGRRIPRTSTTPKPRRTTNSAHEYDAKAAKDDAAQTYDEEKAAKDEFRALCHLCPPMPPMPLMLSSSLFPGAVHHFPPLLPSSPFAPLFFFLFSGVCLRAFCWERTLLFGGVWRFPPSSGVGERSGHPSGCFFEAAGIYHRVTCTAAILDSK
ncbi:hypothetical protein BDB00DRAFT_880641 [Zychaea mexicana]|uniref:uncharacterized protein n=1 Tax=Zychaea mexicana TaxID=64656 RepID=UPI0022FEE4EE|nr:uncharacterized protein BDB00DRAFT_880641 [Zychaea mexicana]KAI9466453.1 hypothetical protein BDB00DRAFT_880641 [Zychaea mexicana]